MTSNTAQRFMTASPKIVSREFIRSFRDAQKKVLVCEVNLANVEAAAGVLFGMKGVPTVASNRVFAPVRLLNLRGASAC